MEREMDGRQQLATPGMFGTLSDSEDSKDHLEDDATQTAHNDTGELDTTIERENPDEASINQQQPNWVTSEKLNNCLNVLDS